MRILSPLYGDRDPALSTALKNSVSANVPGVELEVVRPRDPHLVLPFCGKVEAFREVLATMPDGEEFVFIDDDCLVLLDPSCVFIQEGDFDLAICKRPSPFPINTGVLFGRASDRLRDWADRWYERTTAWAINEPEAKRYAGGTDQAAFLDLAPDPLVKIAYLDYRLWNLCQNYESFWPGKTGVLHFKGHYHDDLLHNRVTDLPSLVVEEWERYRAKKRWDEIARHFRKHDSLLGVEVGVWRGANIASLLRLMPNLLMIGVDPWLAPGVGSEYYETGDEIAKLDQDHFEEAYARAKKAVEFAGNRVVLSRETSVVAAKRIPDRHLDFVFIDGDHSEAGCREDIETWRWKVKPNGWLCGHDYNHAGYPKWGVKEAVDNFCFKHGLLDRLELGDDHTWFVTGL